MRDRSQAHTVPIVGTWHCTDLKFGGIVQTASFNETVVDLESLMWDDATGGSKVNKPCTHLTYIVDNLVGTRSVYHTEDGSNVPNPRYRYDGYPTGAQARLGVYRPTSSITEAQGYIPVTVFSTDDLGGCVFDAFNQYVNSVRALDASTSIAELGETPMLFQIWQRRKALPSNLVSGFLSYSFGWKPIYRDLVNICRELRQFPTTVRRRLKSIGDGYVVRHYKFNLSASVNDLSHITSIGQALLYDWSKYLNNERSVSKSRLVCVTIRARVKPKLTGNGQQILNKLGSMGLIPSLATVWAVTRLSFVIDWFYNIGGAIENLQGSLTHDVSDVSVCVSDARTRVIEVRCEDVGGYNNCRIGLVTQKYYKRQLASVPVLPPLKLPTRPMNYVLLALLSLTKTKSGAKLLRRIDGTPLSKQLSAKINAFVDKQRRGANPYFLGSH